MFYKEKLQNYWPHFRSGWAFVVVNTRGIITPGKHCSRGVCKDSGVYKKSLSQAVSKVMSRPPQKPYVEAGSTSHFPPLPNPQHVPDIRRTESAFWDRAIPFPGVYVSTFLRFLMASQLPYNFITSHRHTLFPVAPDTVEHFSSAPAILWPSFPHSNLKRKNLINWVPLLSSVQ